MVLLFLVVLGRMSWNDRVGDGVYWHVSDVELEVKLVGDVLDGECACLATVERHCSELQLTSWRDVIPDVQTNSLQIPVLSQEIGSEEHARNVLCIIIRLYAGNVA